MAKVNRYRDKETGEPEPLDALIRRFKKVVTADRILYECRRKEYFLKKSLKRKAKSEEARKRTKKNYKPKY